MGIIVAKEISAVYALRITMQQMSGVDSLSDGSLKKAKTIFLVFISLLPFHEAFFSLKHRDPIPQKLFFLSFFFYLMNFKICPEKMP